MNQLTGVHLVTLGCARNDVDSEELAGRLAREGFALLDEPADADIIVVNTCGFIEQAKKDSIDEILAASDHKADGVRSVVAVGCMAERYGKELAAELPEADAVLGFDSYATLGDKLRQILAGEHVESHVPRDRRTLLPITPVDRRRTGAQPGHDITSPLDPGIAPVSGPPVLRRRLGQGPSAPLKLASGCDRRCTFCAIPRFRGSYLSRPPEEIVTEAQWLVSQGVKEVFLVSENTSSYGKDLGDTLALEKLLPTLSAVEGLEWIRLSYLQPAEIKDSLLDAMAATDKVVPYFDISFQHASNAVLRKMRRFGDPESFVNLIERVRQRVPHAGIRSNFIVGFPGESVDDVDTLMAFLGEARLDAIGVFAYSDEDNTEAATFTDKLDADEIAARRDSVSALADELVAQRAEDRIGEESTMLVEVSGEATVGRVQTQGPEVDGETLVHGVHPVGAVLPVRIVDAQGADLVAEVIA